MDVRAELTCLVSAIRDTPLSCVCVCVCVCVYCVCVIKHKHSEYDCVHIQCTQNAHLENTPLMLHEFEIGGCYNLIS
jgi:hypothetical protein